MCAIYVRKIPHPPRAYVWGANGWEGEMGGTEKKVRLEQSRPYWISNLHSFALRMLASSAADVHPSDDLHMHASKLSVQSSKLNDVQVVTTMTVLFVAAVSMLVMMVCAREKMDGVSAMR